MGVASFFEAFDEELLDFESAAHLLGSHALPCFATDSC